MADQRPEQRRATSGQSRGPRGRTGPSRAGSQRRRSDAVPDARSSAPRPRLTGRAAILVLVLAVLALSYTSSLRAYLQQRDHIQDLKTKIAARQAAIESLEDEKERWQDPAYIEQQARERFGYVMPGEKAYVALDADGNRIQSEAELSDPSQVGDQTPTAWWEDAWSSVELAGNPPKTQMPANEIDGSKETTP